MQITEITDGTYRWLIPQQLIDEGIHPFMPWVQMAEIAIRHGLLPKIDGEHRTVRFADTRGALFLRPTIH